MYMVSKILITGGSGLVGYGIRYHTKKYLEKYPDVEFIFLSSSHCDLTNYNQSLEYFHKLKPDYVIHLAAVVGGLFKNMSQNVEMFEKNMLINMNVLKICHIMKVKKLVCCLSTCIFPDNIAYPINETQLHLGAPHFSNEGYSYAKRMLEVHCRLYQQQYNDNFICVIPTNIYGINDNFDLYDSHVIPGLIHKCYLAKHDKQPFKIKGNGKPLRQFIYNKDLGELLLWTLLEYHEKESIILSVDEKDEISIKDVVNLIAQEFNYQDNIVFEDNDQGQYKKTADNSKLRKYLPNYQFAPIQEGLKETIQWFIKNYNLVRK
jgi:GDP-L-fucose synthase